MYQIIALILLAIITYKIINHVVSLYMDERVVYNKEAKIEKISNSINKSEIIVSNTNKQSDILKDHSTGNYNIFIGSKELAKATSAGFVSPDKYSSCEIGMKSDFGFDDDY